MTERTLKKKTGRRKGDDSFFCFNNSKTIWDIPEDTRRIVWHVMPSVRSLTELMQRCSHVEEIKYSFSLQENMSERVRKWHEKNDIPFTFTEDKKAFQSAYCQEIQRRFFSMTEEEKEQFQELLDLRLLETELFRRYYCLNGEKRISHAKLAKHFGLNRASFCAQLVQAILHFLFPDIRVQKDAERRACRLQKHICSVRIHRGKIERKKRLVDALGISFVPDTVDARSTGRFIAIQKYIKAHPDAFSLFRDIYPLYAEVVSLRYGFGAKKDTKLLREVAVLFHVSREQIRQWEDAAFRLLGIRSALSKKDMALLAYKKHMPTCSLQGKSFEERKKSIKNKNKEIS